MEDISPQFHVPSMEQEVTLPPDQQMTTAAVQAYSAQTQSPLTANTNDRSSITLSPGADIQSAIDVLNSQGGGTVYLRPGTYYPTRDITLYSNISVVGTTQFGSVIDFGSNNAGFKAIGTSDTFGSGQIIDFVLENLWIKHSAAAAAIDIKFGQAFKLRVLNSDNSIIGVRISDSYNYTVDRVDCNSNSSDGFYLVDADATASGALLGSFTSVGSFTNGGHGFNIQGTRTTTYRFYNCFSIANTGAGFSIASTTTAQWSDFVSCAAQNNTGGGFVTASPGVRIFGGLYAGNTTIDIDMSGANVNHSSVIGAFAGSINTGERDVQVIATNAWGFGAASNQPGIPTNDKRVQWLQNGSGGTITAGSVVVLNSTSSGFSFTTTTTSGDNKVWGVLLADVANGAMGAVLVQGKTTLLKANGTTAISIGDFLSTYTAAGIAQKASSGDMAFAIALEAYATADSNGVLDALVITPRKV